MLREVRGEPSEQRDAAGAPLLGSQQHLHEFRAGLAAELREGAMDVVLHGWLSDPEAEGDFTVPCPIRDERSNLAFARGEEPQQLRGGAPTRVDPDDRHASGLGGDHVRDDVGPLGRGERDLDELAKGQSWPRFAEAFDAPSQRLRPCCGVFARHGLSLPSIDGYRHTRPEVYALRTRRREGDPMTSDSIGPEARKLVADFFEAMQAAGTQETEMMRLFAEDAVYVEPFSGRPREHEGKAAIREAMAAGWKNPLPEMRLEVERVETDGKMLRADWVCYSPGLPNGRGAGTNEFTLRDGLIVRLETRLRMA